MNAPESSLQPAPPRVVEVIFDHPPRSLWRSIVWPIAGTLLFFILLALLASTLSPSLTSWSDALARDIHKALHDQQEITLTDISKPSPPELPKEEPAQPEHKVDPPATTPTKPVKRSVTKDAAPSTQDGNPTPPAQAGQILAQDPSDDAPLDLTSTIFVSGTANAYAGGATTSAGTHTTAVDRDVVDRNARPTTTPGSSTKARQVQLDATRWDCPWPKEADNQEINEQSVILRVHVDSHGRVRETTLLRDPGFGFGQAALACAMRTRFSPARDDAGNKIEATSPPIRVRFSR